MYWQILMAVSAVAFGTLFLVSFWDEIRESVAKKLRNIGWEKSYLMDAWIHLDRIASGIRCKFFLKNKKQEIKLFEKKYLIEEIDDPEVLDELKKRGLIEKNIMTYIE